MLKSAARSHSQEKHHPREGHFASVGCHALAVWLEMKRSSFTLLLCFVIRADAQTGYFIEELRIYWMYKNLYI